MTIDNLLCCNFPIITNASSVITNNENVGALSEHFENKFQNDKSMLTQKAEILMKTNLIDEEDMNNNLTLFELTTAISSL